MTKKNRDLREAVRDPGFSPSVRHVAELAELAGDEALGEDVERALARLGGALAPALASVLAAATPPARIRLLRAIGRTGDSSEPALTLLYEALAGDDERTRRAAATALGKVGLRAETSERANVEAALLAAWPRAKTDTERRMLAEAIGKVGGERARTLLASVEGGDENLERVVSRARLVVARTALRGVGGIRADVAPSHPLAVAFTCRRGLEHLLIDELGPSWSPRLDPHARGIGRVFATMRGPLASAFVARTAERFGIVLPNATLPREEDLAEVVTRALLEHERVLAGLTDGPVRFRVSWQDGGHKRAVVWNVAERIARESKILVNDPAESAWELEVGDARSGRPGAARGPRKLAFTLRPRGLPDPRFEYRVQDVPAASHPTIAAALARVAHAGKSSDHDVVWDPFVGSGLELVERAKLGPARALFGSDREPTALDAARANVERAGVTATLLRADALSYFPEGTNVVVTNPPMGRRVHRQSDIGDLLVRFVEHVGQRLPSGGRLVWLSPQAKLTREAGERLRLHVQSLALVDVGGFEAELQVMRAR